jgi:hypothetical protein
MSRTVKKMKCELQKIVDFFGKTEDVHEAGLMLADGTLIDMSGKQVFGTKKLENQKIIYCDDRNDWNDRTYKQGCRVIDHIAVDYFLKKGKCLEDFLEENKVVNISRGCDSFLVIKLACRPTTEQAIKLGKMIREVERIWICNARTGDLYEKRFPRPLDLQIAVSKLIK